MAKQLRLKAVWGPNREVVDSRCIKWMFACVYESGHVQGYSLRFHFDTRKFSVRYIKNKEAKYISALAEKDLFALPELQREEVITGTRVTDILKARLSDEHIARAIALAIQKRG